MNLHKALNIINPLYQRERAIVCFSPTRLHFGHLMSPAMILFFLSLNLNQLVLCLSCTAMSNFCRGCFDFVNLDSIVVETLICYHQRKC